MFIIDDILLFPASSMGWIFREIHDAAQQERANEAEALTAELSRAYMLLEAGQMTEEEFQAREKELLDELDEMEGHGGLLEDMDAEEEKDLAHT